VEEKNARKHLWSMNQQKGWAVKTLVVFTIIMVREGATGHKRYKKNCKKKRTKARTKSFGTDLETMRVRRKRVPRVQPERTKKTQTILGGKKSEERGPEKSAETNKTQSTERVDQGEP